MKAHISSTNMRQKELIGNDMAILKPQTHIQSFPKSSTGDQAFKHKSLWGTFSFLLPYPSIPDNHDFHQDEMAVNSENWAHQRLDGQYGCLCLTFHLTSCWAWGQRVNGQTWGHQETQQWHHHCLSGFRTSAQVTPR